MSNRALRRLQHGADLVPGATEENGEEDKEELEPSPPQHSRKNKKKHSVNPFELLADAADKEEKVEGEVENEEETEKAAEAKSNDVAISTSIKKKKQKKKKKKKPEDPTPPAENQVDDEIEASLQEVNRILGDAGLTPADVAHQQQDAQCAVNMKALLSIEYKYLNADNELRRRFGSRIVQGDHGRPRQRNRMPQKQSRFVQPKDIWPIFGRTGLSMTMIAGGAGHGKVQFFTFEHSSQYQNIQFQFLDAVQSYNPQNIASLSHDYPHHIDSLIQLSEVFYIHEDPQTAVDLIERALYVMEGAFHPRFNMATGNCRLDFRRQENRALFLVLFKHLTAVAKRGCNRTALELCKLLLSLDPDGDPMCVLLMIDYYALCSGQYAFLIRLFEEWESFRNLSQLPNFAFSVPLALFHQSKDNPSLAQKADTMLEDSLLMFPGLLVPLLDKCGVSADRKVVDHPFFNPAGQASHKPALQQLVGLYVGRCHSLWKDAEVMEWMERVVKSTLSHVDAKDPRVDSFAEKRKMRYQGTPRNIYRHLIISNIREAITSLPPELANTPVLTYDPLPPLDAVVSYRPPGRRPRGNAEGENVLSLFLRSLLPNFNTLAQPGEAAGNAERVGRVDREEEAVAAQEEGRNQELRRGVGLLMDAMRDLLNNIRLAAPPMDERQEGGEEDQDSVEEDDLWDEF